MNQRGQLIPGLVSITFRALSPADIIRLAAEAGLQAIEWGADVHVPPGDLVLARRVGDETRAAGLAVSSYGSYYKAGQAPERFEAILATARALGAPRIRVWAGTVGAEEADSAVRRAITDDLRRVVDRSAGEGVRVAAEFHSGTLTSNAASAWALLQDVPGLESYWQPRAGIQPAEALEDLRVLSGRIVHAHVFHWYPTWERQPLSAGAACWPQYLKALAALGRTVQVQLEYVKEDQPGQLRTDVATLLAWLGTVDREKRLKDSGGGS